MTETTPDTVSVKFTRAELRRLHLFLYGTDFSDIAPELQSASDKIIAAHRKEIAA